MTKKKLELYFDGKNYYLNNYGDHLAMLDIMFEDEEGHGYELPKRAQIVAEFTPPEIKTRRYTIEHHWCTSVIAENLEEAFEIATTQFLNDYNLKAFGLDLLESMKMTKGEPVE